MRNRENEKEKERERARGKQIVRDSDKQKQTSESLRLNYATPWRSGPRNSRSINDTRVGYNGYDLSEVNHYITVAKEKTEQIVSLILPKQKA